VDCISKQCKVLTCVIGVRVELSSDDRCMGTGWGWDAVQVLSSIAAESGRAWEVTVRWMEGAGEPLSTGPNQ